MIVTFRKERAQGLVEYALILVLIAVVVIAGVTFFGQFVGNLFSTIVTGIPSV